jgi:hypothetical protein
MRSTLSWLPSLPIDGFGSVLLCLSSKPHFNECVINAWNDKIARYLKEKRHSLQLAGETVTALKGDFALLRRAEEKLEVINVGLYDHGIAYICWSRRSWQREL